MATWEQNMAATAAGGSAAIQKEIDKAKAVVASGSGTTATTRYINQLNALKDGAPLSKVISGSYDNYSGSKDTSGTYKNGQLVSNGLADAGRVNSVGTTVGAPVNWNMIKSYEEAQYAATRPTTPISSGLVGGVAGVSMTGQSVGQGNGVTQFDDPADNRTVSAALTQGMQQVMPDMSGAINTGIMVIAGSAVLVAVSKLFGK